MLPTEFATGLRVGSSVELRWTNCNRSYRANGIITKLNGKTCRVKTTHDVASDNSKIGYPAGTELVSALPFTKGHTQGNGVWPVTKSDDALVEQSQKIAGFWDKVRQKISESITVVLPVGAGKTTNS